jgi:hypothetical protein
VPLATTLEGAIEMVGAFERLFKGPLEVRSLQEWHVLRSEAELAAV